MSAEFKDGSTVQSISVNDTPLTQEENSMVVMLSEDDNDTLVHAKAKRRGQATFTLVEQDKSAPKTICFWIMKNIETAPEDKLRTALEAALKFRKHPNRKDPD